MILSPCLAKLPWNRNPCVLAPLRLCVAATAFLRLNGAMSRSLASSQGTEACRLASRSRKRGLMRAFPIAVSTSGLPMIDLRKDPAWIREHLRESLLRSGRFGGLSCFCAMSTPAPSRRSPAQPRPGPAGVLAYRRGRRFRGPYRQLEMSQAAPHYL